MVCPVATMVASGATMLSCLFFCMPKKNGWWLPFGWLVATAVPPGDSGVGGCDELFLGAGPMMCPAALVVASVATMALSKNEISSEKNG